MPKHGKNGLHYTPKENYGKMLYKAKLSNSRSKNFAFPSHELSLENKIIMVSFLVLLCAGSTLAWSYSTKDYAKVVHDGPTPDESHVEAVMSMTNCEISHNAFMPCPYTALNISRGGLRLEAVCPSPLSNTYEANNNECRIDAVKLEKSLTARIFNSDTHTISHASPTFAPIYTVKQNKNERIFSERSRSSVTDFIYTPLEDVRLKIKHQSVSGNHYEYYDDHSSIMNHLDATVFDRDSSNPEIATVRFKQDGTSLGAVCHKQGVSNEECHVSILEQGNTMVIQASQSPLPLDTVEWAEKRKGAHCFKNDKEVDCAANEKPQQVKPGKAYQFSMFYKSGKNDPNVADVTFNTNNATTKVALGKYA